MVDKFSAAVEEFIETEKRYVDGLKILVDVFMVRISGILAQTDLDKIFLNTHAIYSANQDFYNKIKDDRTLENILASFFLQLPVFECYKEYCSRHKKAIEEIENQRAKNSELMMFLLSASKLPETRNIDLLGYLLLPVQRIARYPLLFKQILHYTGQDCAVKKRVEDALMVSEERLREINHEMKNIESLDLLRRVRDGKNATFSFAGRTRTGEQRMVVRQKRCLYREKEARCVLCNDMLLVVDEGRRSAAVLCGPVEPKGVVVDRSEDERASFHVQIGEARERVCFFSDADRREMVYLVETLPAGKADAVKRVVPESVAGTLEVTVVGGRGLVRERSEMMPYAVGEVCGQRDETTDRSGNNVLWDEKLFFFLEKIEETIRFSVYDNVKFHPPVFLGSCSVDCSILEYYGETETEEMDLALDYVPCGYIEVRLRYRRRR
ncbi:MAG: uncharacterized protein A8A55_0850 [Amphiamblys sp. WSBS2006]|nr:MAG: uncharacterized protein A8A55_0850 [Amphiamblys sp. WSBS2006]